ncbi:response regulator [Patescibacteria group bacterium]|nr:response regulator [Patescibacteria group bacterium]
MVKIKQKILIVNEQNIFAEKITNSFKKRSFVVFEANSLKQALVVFRKEKPDIVLVGGMLDDDTMGGYELCKQVKEKSPDTPVIIMSIFGDTFISEAAEVGADNVIKRPVKTKDMTKLMHVIDDALDQSTLPAVVERILHGSIEEFVDDHMYLVEAENIHDRQFEKKPYLVAEAVKQSCMECKEKGILSKEGIKTRGDYRKLFLLGMRFATEYVNKKDEKYRKKK